MELLNRRFKKNENLAWRIIDGEAFIIHPQEGLLYPLNTVATRIWELLDGKNSASEINNIIQQEFDEDNSVIENDVVSFLQEMLKADLVCIAK